MLSDLCSLLLHSKVMLWSTRVRTKLAKTRILPFITRASFGAVALMKSRMMTICGSSGLVRDCYLCFGATNIQRGLMWFSKNNDKNTFTAFINIG